MRSSRALGILYALCGFSLWVVADASIKLAAGAALPAGEIVGAQGLVLVVALVLLCGARGELRALWPKQPGRQFLRAGLDFINVLCVAIALRHLPLTVFYVLVFLSPMAMAVGGHLFLGETLHWQEALAIFVGFAGVVVAVDPFAAHGAGDRVGYAACLVCVLCFSASMVWLRRMTQTERQESLLFFSAFMQTVGGLLAIDGSAAAVGVRLGFLLVLAGIGVGLGNLFSYRALRMIAAKTVGQYHYSQLVTGGAAAWVIWHEVLGWRLVAGAGLILGSGVFVAGRQGGGERRASGGQGSALDPLGP